MGLCRPGALALCVHDRLFSFSCVGSFTSPEHAMLYLCSLQKKGVIIRIWVGDIMVFSFETKAKSGSANC